MSDGYPTMLEYRTTDSACCIRLRDEVSTFEEFVDLLVRPLALAIGYQPETLDACIAPEGMVVVDPTQPCSECQRLREALRYLEAYFCDVDEAMAAACHGVLLGLGFQPPDAEK